mgnify:CR=1 FL=1
MLLLKMPRGRHVVNRHQIFYRDKAFNFRGGMYQSSLEGGKVWLQTFSFKAGASYFILSTVMLALAWSISFYIIPFIQELSTSTFIGLFLSNYLWLLSLVSRMFVILGFILLGWPLALYIVNEYQANEKGVFCKSLSLKGIVRVNINKADIRSISIRQTFLGRILGYGDIIISTNSRHFKLTGVENPSEAERILRKILQLTDEKRN